MDLNNIDLRKITTEQIVGIVIILITFIISSKVYKSGQSKFDLLRERNNSEVQKNNLLSQIKQLEGTLNSYNTTLKKKDLSENIDIINTIAESSDIKIHSLRPLAKQDYPVYSKLAFNIKFETLDYHLIGKFIRNLENHPSLFFIDSLTIEQDSGIGTKKEKYVFKVELNLSVFIYNG